MSDEDRLSPPRLPSSTSWLLLASHVPSLSSYTRLRPLLVPVVFRYPRPRPHQFGLRVEFTAPDSPPELYAHTTRAFS